MAIRSPPNVPSAAFGGFYLAKRRKPTLRGTRLKSKAAKALPKASPPKVRAQVINSIAPQGWVARYKAKRRGTVTAAPVAPVPPVTKFTPYGAFQEFSWKLETELAARNLLFSLAPVLEAIDAIVFVRIQAIDSNGKVISVSSTSDDVQNALNYLDSWADRASSQTVLDAIGDGKPEYFVTVITRTVWGKLWK